MQKKYIAVSGIVALAAMAGVAYAKRKNIENRVEKKLSRKLASTIDALPEEVALPSVETKKRGIPLGITGTGELRWVPDENMLVLSSNPKNQIRVASLICAQEDAFPEKVEVTVLNPKGGLTEERIPHRTNSSEVIGWAHCLDELSRIRSRLLSSYKDNKTKIVVITDFSELLVNRESGYLTPSDVLDVVEIFHSKGQDNGYYLVLCIDPKSPQLFIDHNLTKVLNRCFNTVLTFENVHEEMAKILKIPRLITQSLRFTSHAYSGFFYKNRKLSTFSLYDPKM